MEKAGEGDVDSKLRMFKCEWEGSTSFVSTTYFLYLKYLTPISTYLNLHILKAQLFHF